MLRNLQLSAGLFLLIMIFCSSQLTSAQKVKYKVLYRNNKVRSFKLKKLSSERAEALISEARNKQAVTISNLRTESASGPLDHDSLHEQLFEPYVVREGPNLIFKGKKNGTFQMINTSADPDAEGTFSLCLGEIPDLNSYILYTDSIGENTDITLVNEDNCNTTLLEAWPHLSRDKNYIFTIENFQATYCRFSLYQVIDKKPRRYLSVQIEALGYPESVRWISSNSFVFTLIDKESGELSYYLMKFTV